MGTFEALLLIIQPFVQQNLLIYTLNSENVNILSLFVEITMTSCPISTCNRVADKILYIKRDRCLFTSILVSCYVVKLNCIPTSSYGRMEVIYERQNEPKFSFIITLTKSFLTHDKARLYCIIIGYRRTNDETEDGHYHGHVILVREA